jgi:hypothetical protein
MYLCMYASHLQVHAAFEPGRAGRGAKHLPVFVLLLAASVFLLAVSDFSSFRAVPMRTRWPDRQC